MRTLMIATAALAATTALATPAAAQTTDPTFTGLRGTIIGGYDGIRPGSTEDSDVDGDDQTVDGFVYGFDVGYDMNLGGAVVGVEAELTDSTGKVEANSADPNYYGYGEVGTGRDIYVGARVGTLVTPRTLVYAKGGYTNGRLNVLATDGTTELDDHFDLDGWRVGAGVEQAIGTNSYVKLEYRYSNYSDADFTFDDGTTTDTFEVDTDRHQVMAGVGFRF
ncbi:outer membrane protein [Stakelama tenebrarum]|uniref:Porin family protein n=1 Tax=Stakelama tenebrarum TaxID=2711215 RepID=A0A6G6Y0E7_9SPHN|nr:outer membrane beta-barrel protein [Sphingosinithalassobacter tenebrarum]QIG78379.1 porin family protein [Sphingosinithalassobacter tenebrarum]